MDGKRRLDLYVEEAGCLIWVAPRNLGGVSPGQLGRIWMGETDGETIPDLVQRGAMMPMALYQDDGYTVRFVLGDLTADEEAQWTARASWKLDVACGQVFVSGILTPDFASEFAQIAPAEPNGSYWAGAYVDVPPGVYRVEVYGFPPGELSSGWGMMTNPRTFGRHPSIKPEKPLDFFRRTRPGEEPPPWIEDKPEEGFLYVDFIVRLLPLAEAQDLPPPVLEDDGCLQWEFRKPAICPIGIRSGIGDD